MNNIVDIPNLAFAFHHLLNEPSPHLHYYFPELSLLLYINVDGKVSYKDKTLNLLISLS